MRTLVKRLASFFLIPATRWYLRKPRAYKYGNISIKISPGVFHPGLFHSTRFLLSYISEIDLKSKTFLELGCGTGLISVVASSAGAMVTASDLNPAAVANVRENAERNQAAIHIVHSDLFENIVGAFDYIVINPPYYAKDATSNAELAWNCGKDFEYFKKLFSELPEHVHGNSSVIMVLTKGCDLTAIFRIADEFGFSFELIKEKNVLFDEKDYLFSLKQVNSSALSQV
jgi:release factor glutamine methyltransferase